MTIEAMKEAWRLKIEAPAQKNVLVVLANFANQDHEAYPSVATISAYTAFSERTVQAALRALEDAGLIAREVRFHANGRSKTALYRLVFMDGIGCDNCAPSGGMGAKNVGGGRNSRTGEGATAAPNPLLKTLKEPKDSTPLPLIGGDSLPGFDDPAPTPKMKPAESKAAQAKAQADALIETWNAICARVKKATHVNDTRRALVLKRFKEEFNSDQAEWERFCRRCARSPFLTGDNDRDWRPPSFDWMMRVDKIANVLDGVYDDKSGNQGSSAPRRFTPSPGTI